MLLELDMVQSIALAVVLLLFGEFLVKKINFLSKYCIPAPVVGGLSFAILALFLRQAGIIEFAINDTLQTLTMTMFFTSVGFSASFKLLKKGGVKVIIFLGLSVVLLTVQNIIGVAFASMFELNPLLGMATGSVPLVGGHGTAAAIGGDIEAAGIMGASTLAVAAATFGLVAGGMIGGPVGKRLIEKHNLVAKKEEDEKSYELDSSSKVSEVLKSRNFYVGTFEILIAMGIGTIISPWLERVTGFSFPIYIGAMVAGAIMRNISDVTKKYDVPKVEIDIIGGISLSLFLSMALMSLRLWELAELAIPMIAVLVAQVVFMFLFAYFVTFRVMGKDYDAAVLAAGHCGFGLGATPNGIANMNSVTEKFGPAPAAFFILPLVGSLFIDFFNISIITAFINFF